MPDINIAHAGLEGAGTGAATGAGTGAAIGTSIFPGIGTGVGAAIGAGIGAIVGFFGGRSKAKDAYGDLQASEKSMGAAGEAIAAPVYDAGLSEFARELRKEKRMVETGMTPEFQVGKDLIERAGAGAMSVATRFNNPALAMSFINRIQTGTGANINKLIGTIGAQRGQYTAAVGNVLTNLATREMELSQRNIDFEMFKALGDKSQAVQTYSDWRQNKNMMNMYALSQLPGLAGMADFGGSGDGVTPSSTLGAGYMDQMSKGTGPGQ